MGWQGASWHHPAQTHTCKMLAHMCSLYHLPQTHCWTCIHTHTRLCSHSNSHQLLFRDTHVWLLLLMKFFGEEEAKRRAAWKFANTNVFLTVFPSHMGLLHMLHSLGSKCRDLGPICKHRVYKCFALLFVCPQSPRKPQGEKENGEKGKHNFFLQLRWWGKKT